MAKKSNGKPAGPKHTEVTELTGRIGYSELIDDVCDLISSSTDHNMTKAQIADVVRSTFRCVGDALAKKKTVSVHNLFLLEPVYRQPRQGRNPQKPSEMIDIPAQWTIRLKVGKALKADLNA